MKMPNELNLNSECVIHHGDCRDLLSRLPSGFAKLVVTSPPYNIGKPYEVKMDLPAYLSQQAEIIAECSRVLSDDGSICWQVGNFVERGAIVPLDVHLFHVFYDLGLRCRNRIIWTFGHGLHASRRFSGRYETILWFTKTDKYYFDLDPIRIPQKYPGKKYFKGPKRGQLSGNPLGKNPGDIWEIPNVKANHVEKTDHPCQFPIELVERLVLSMTKSGDWVLDPFMGVGSSLIAALMHNRKAIGAEIEASYIRIAEQRMKQARSGHLLVRPRSRQVFDPTEPHKNAPPQRVQIEQQPNQLDFSNTL